MDLPEFHGSVTERNFRIPAQQGGNSGFHFPGAVSYYHRKLKSRVCSVLKYYYNSPHIFHCKVQSDSPR